jgi:type II secretory ATPase GspE/PulE/Tfp pilus assembly ATPase PilB-like protein
MSNQPPEIELPPITFLADGENEDEKQANLDAVLPSPGYPSMALLIADSITKRADLIVLDYSPQMVKLRLQIDGLWHELPQQDRGSGDYMLASLKKISNLNYLERRVRQEGEFAAEFLNAKTKFNLVSQGVPTGERVVIHVNRKRPSTDTLADLGMRQKMIDELKEHLGRDSGLILVSTLPGDGLTTFYRGVLDAFDRFMRDYYSIEEVNRVEDEVINVNPITFDESAGQTSRSAVVELLLKEPDVLVFPEIPDGETFDYYCDLANEHEKLVLARIPAKNSVEAILRVMALKPTLSKFAQALLCVTYQRTIRRLCEKCRQPFSPPPQLLQQMGLPPGRVQSLYNHTQPPPPEQAVDQNGKPIEIQICPKCSGLGFMERTGLFELLNVSESFRKALSKTTDLASLTNLAKSEGYLSLREEGVVLVAKGTTSVQELQRVLQK